MKTTWKQLIENEMHCYSETFDDVIRCTPTLTGVGWHHRKFDPGFGGGGGGDSFTIWTQTRVYFPVCYDGAVWYGSVPRNPDGTPTEPIGGG